jgi:rod shape-determining protein MreB
VVIAEDPLSCVVLGSGKMLDELDLLKRVTISS